MYQILCDGNILYDPRDDELIVTNPKCKLEVNKVGEASFTIFYNHPLYGEMKKLKSVFEIVQDGETIFRGRMTNDTRDFNNIKVVDLEGVMAYFNDSLIPPFNFPDDFIGDADFNEADESGNVVDFFLGKIIDWHNEQVQPFQRFKKGIVTVADRNNYITRSSEERMSAWEVLKSKLFESSLGGYLCIRYEEDGNYIDYLEDFYLANNQKVEFGENLLDITNESSAMETYSAIIPLGKKKNEIDSESTDTSRLTIEGLGNGSLSGDIVKEGAALYSKSAVEEIGWICVPVSESTWDDVTEATNLQEKGKSFLENRGMRLANTITVKAVDLHFSDAEIEAFRIYRKIHVNSRPHNHEGLYRLTQLDIDLMNPQNTIITMGDTQKSMIDINAVTKRDTETLIQNIKRNVYSSMKHSVTNTKSMFYVSTSETELSGGRWTTTPPTWEDGKFIWMKNVIQYGSGKTTEDNPVCITGSKGVTGDTGVGVSNVSTEYYLSNSKEEQTDGEWAASMPSWSEGKYLWTRFLIKYTDGTSEYVSPFCDSSWESSNLVKKELTETFNSKFEQYSDDITLEVDGSLGSKANIVLRAGGVEKKTELELSKVREAFANDNTSTTISAGMVTFNSGTLVINSNNFKVSSDGNIEASSGTVGAITLSKTGIYSNNEAYVNSYAGWYRPLTISTSETCFFAGASGAAGTNAKFLVTYGGALTATDATINGTITTEYSSYKAKLDGGGLELYFDDVLCGTVNTKYWYGASTEGISLRVEEGGNYIMFSHADETQGSGYTVDYYLNAGWSSNYDEMHIFQTSARFLSDVYLDGRTDIGSLVLRGAGGKRYLVTAYDGVLECSEI